MDTTSPRTMTAHQRARKERAEAKAAALAAKGTAQWDRAKGHTAGIEPGQPILVGHHSEGRHRRAIERSHAATDRAVETMRAAGHAEHAARRAGRAIHSDDPEAVEALTAQLAQMTAQRDAWKRHNRTARPADGLITPEVALRTGARVPAYALTNLGASIRRVTKRIAALSAVAS